MTDTLSILVADDNHMNRQLAYHLLYNLGCEPVCVEDGKQALDALEKKFYDMVLLDIEMPVMDGIETTKHILQRFQGKPVRPYIVAVTANTDAEGEQMCLKAGMDFFMKKPLSAKALTKLFTLLYQRNQPQTQPKEVLGSSNGSKNSTAVILECFPALDSSMEEELNNIAALFVRHVPVILKESKHFMHAGDLDNLQKHAHKLKGIALGLGLEKIADSCVALMKLTHVSGAQLHLDALEVEYTMLQSRLAFLEKTVEPV